MTEVIYCVLFPYRLLAKVLVFPATPIHNNWILGALSFFFFMNRWIGNSFGIK